jgi:hypothetical protein
MANLHELKHLHNQIGRVTKEDSCRTLVGPDAFENALCLIHNVICLSLVFPILQQQVQTNLPHTLANICMATHEQYC